MKPRIVVYGGVHLDIWADYDVKYRERIDQIGELRYSIGGTGYNVAYVLAKHKVNTTFYSVLNNNSYNTAWIKRELGATRIKARLQINRDTYVENGFVAIRSHGELERAITSSYLSKAALDLKKVSAAAKGCSLAVIDCNFEAQQIRKIVDVCRFQDLKIIIAATSDSKVCRVKDIVMSTPIEALVMNEAESKAFFKVGSADDITLDMIPEKLNYCIVTLAERGHYVFHDGERKYYKAPAVEEVRSTSGAGDALLAAVAQTIASGGYHEEECNRLIYEYVGNSLTEITTYLKPTKRKVSKAAIAVWVIAVIICIVACVLSFQYNRKDIGSLLTIVGIVLTIATSVRTEMKG